MSIFLRALQECILQVKQMDDMLDFHKPAQNKSHPAVSSRVHVYAPGISKNTVYLNIFWILILDFWPKLQINTLFAILSNSYNS